MRIKVVLVTFTMIVAISTLSFASDVLVEGQALESVKLPTVEGLAGDTYRTYFNSDTGTEITVFRFKGIRVRSEGQEYNGTWSVEKETGKVTIQRFDSSSNVVLGVYTTDGVDGYFIALENVQEGTEMVQDLLRLKMGPADGIMGKVMN